MLSCTVHMELEKWEISWGLMQLINKRRVHDDQNVKDIEKVRQFYSWQRGKYM